MQYTSPRAGHKTQADGASLSRECATSYKNMHAPLCVSIVSHNGGLWHLKQKSRRLRMKKYHILGTLMPRLIVSCALE